MMILLGCMDIDLALRMPKPDELNEQSTQEDEVYWGKWERSNRLSLMIMKRDIPEAFRGAVTDEVTNASDFLAEIQKRFAKNDKAETSTLLASLISMKYKGKGNVREYIMEMSHLASKLKALKLELFDDLLVHLVLISLPAQFNQFKVSYNYQKDKWTLNELISFCVQEEERLKQDKTESAHLASTSKDKGKRKNKDNKVAASNGPEQKKQKVEVTCFFCNKPGHTKKECTKYAAWRVKKGMFLTLGCLSYRKPSDAERCIYVGDDDYSRYGYLFLIHEKSQSLDVFKTFKAEVELQLNKRIKSVRSDRGGEYYGRYDGSGEQRPGPFAKYLEECGIVPQYTMPGSPSMNGVAERRNRTLKDMVRSMICHSALPEKLWGEALKTAAYILNRGCPAEARPYKPHEKKLDSKTVSSYFIGYAERSRGFKFYDPAIRTNSKPQENMPLRKSTRERRNAISDDYIVYLQECEVESGMMEDDPINFQQGMKSSNSQKWIEAMNEEYKSMQDNKVWELVPLPVGTKPIGCKWIFKTKRDSNGNVERYKARLVAKGFTQKEGIDFKETFSPVSTKDSFRIIMALVAHYDLELHQMDVKTAFLNGDIDETIYMVQPENFVPEDSKNMVCKLTKSIYGLKQASRQWYFKFHQIIVSYGFEANLMDECVYHKFSGSKYIFLVLYVDDILLATNDISILHDTKRFLSKHFEMKDLGDASFVLGIQIHRDRSRGILGLSQRTYIDKVLQRYGMQNSKPGDTPVAKGDKFSLNQCPKNSLESQEMQKIPYASAVGSLMYAQVCTRPDIAYIVGMLGRYLSNPGMDHWRAAKRVMRYLQRTKEYMLTYRRLDQLELIGYSDSDFAGCQDSRRSTSGYIYLLAGGAISWRSAKQTLVTSSTMEAEFVTCYEASNQGIWLRNFVTGLRVLDGIERPLKIFCDNKSAALYSNNNRSSTKSKYIDIKFLVVKEKVQSGQISIEHIGTNSMIADPLTKGLPPKVFHEHTAHMGVVSFEDIQI
ncbi:Retrovirus-related Pol polyprotein from transposon TNT 1-94 [Vitis vinifera]|uniref:Retrovirus-related Pol polyprotein from transposon TNT 1-94 n=1 Tax=Vitis vinifera TaxID=29760 RepID=A0A438CGK4_VITVI|nr:Retrovirus-related Pol polyprotein from transposon TNT 1-94 [Vitis vinifera]